MKTADSRKGFEEFCDIVSNTEKDKDKFLSAARLQRVEKQPMSDSRFEALCVLFGFCTVIICFTLIVLFTF